MAEYFGIEVPATSLTQEQAGNVMLQYVLYGYDEERDAKIVDAPVVVDDSDLLAALEDYQEAKAAEKEALEKAGKALDIEDADKEDVETAESGAADDLAEGVPNSADDDPSWDDTAFEGANSAAIEIPDINKDGVTLATRQKLIDAKHDTLSGELTAQTDALKGSASLAKSFTTSLERAKAADAALTKADEGLTTQVAMANAADAGLTPPTLDNQKGESVKITFAGDNVLRIKNGSPVFEDADGKALPASNPDVKAIKELSNYDALVKALAATDSAQKALDSAVSSTQTAAGKILDKATNKDGTDGATAGWLTDATDEDAVKDANRVADLQELIKQDGALDNFINASLNLAAFESLVEEYQVAADQLKAVNEAEDNVADAVKALKDLGYDVAEDNNGTENDDLFIYEDGADAEYFFFGEEGDDVFFFGTQFNFVELAANDNFENGNFGDKNAFEIFAQQQGSDVVLYVETNEVGGNATGLEDIDSITLVGVDLADLQWDGGFLTVA